MKAKTPEEITAILAKLAKPYNCEHCGKLSDRGNYCVQHNGECIRFGSAVIVPTNQ